MSISVYTYHYENDLSEKKKDCLLKSLSIDERKKVFGYKRKIDSDISLISRFLLRNLLSPILKVNPAEIDFFYNKYNRPYLETIDFNVSHSGRRIVIAINRAGRVGIDIEKIRKVEEELVELCFTESEKKYIFGKGIFELKKFFELWTLKESFIKADGMGLSYPLKSFYFSMGNEIKINFLKKESDGEWFFNTFNIDPEYKLSLCSNCADMSNKLIKINNFSDFINE